MLSIWKINLYLLTINVNALLLSIYAYHVEQSKLANDGYEAACDISSRFSCSTVLTSSYSIGFGLMKFITGDDFFLNQPNCYLGIFVYGLLSILSVRNDLTTTAIHLWISLFCNLVSIYLAVILCVLRTVCVVCVLIYAANAANFYLIRLKLKSLQNRIQTRLDAIKHD